MASEGKQSPKRIVKKLEKSRSFKTFKFSDIEWQEIEGSESEDKFIYRTEVTIDGKSYEFVATRSEKDNETKLKFHLVHEGQRVYFFQITIEHSQEAQFDIVRDFSERVDVETGTPILPRRFSVTFYDKVLDYIPNLKVDKAMRHIVENQPRDMNTTLWKERYQETLEVHEYTNTRGLNWVRDY